MILQFFQGRRRFGRLAAVVALGLAVAGAFAVRHWRDGAHARAAFPRVEGRIEIAGLSAPVSILRDARGVPHVVAENEADAFVGLGFAHAQDRLGQMLWLARHARGRTAEVEGAAGLAPDRLARTLDLVGLAERQYEELDGATREVLAAYAHGVNARIGRIRNGEESPPVGWARRRVELEGWSPADSLAVMKLYAWGLSGALDASLVLSDLIEHLGGFAARRFFPDPSREQPYAVPGIPPATAARRPARGAASADPLRRALGLEGHAVGSSAWVVGGAHTESGRPLVVADVHLEPTAPALLHLAHVRGGALDVVGAALPGVPAFWTGHNRRVAWASTHARAATADLYVETVHPRTPRYHDGRRWRDLAERVETIQVRGAPDVELVVQSTRHGPLVNPLLDESREALALAWAGARSGDRSLTALLGAARARSADELVAALASHGAPALAVIYADAEGAAGLQVAGWIPRRPIATGLVPLPGRARHYDWQGPIPYEALPALRLTAGRGWLIAADNRFPPAREDGAIEWLWRSGERARRIDQLLRSTTRVGPVDLRHMVRIQSDVRMLRGQELVADALAVAGDRTSLAAEAREVVSLLEGWNGEARADSVGAAAFHVFLGTLTEQLLGERLGGALLARYLALPQGDPAQLVVEIVRDAALRGDGEGWVEAPRVREAVRVSLRETWFRLSYGLGPNREKWSWGRLHPLRFRPFGPGRRAAGAPGLGPFPYGGSTTTVGVAEYDPAMPYAVRATAIFRFAIDASELDEALVSLAPGQSEHPGHPHFRDGLDDWLRGKPALLASSRLLVDESAVSRLELAPAP